jgi:hypothetical protein
MCILDNLISVVLNSGVWTPISVVLNFGVSTMNVIITFSFLKLIPLHFRVLTINNIRQDYAKVTEIIHVCH